ncbi:MAG: PKD domain-containing protein, partial [Candidatus Cloacimonetes bacterium]|nr:PKD domain-containing protein [Candidatus Cloacimonadota bacterium]
MVYQYSLNLQTGVLSDTGISIAIPDVFNVAIHPGGKYAIICSENMNNSKVIKLNEDNSISVHQVLNIGNVQSALYSPDGTKALLGITNESPNKLKVYDVTADGNLVFSSSHNLTTSASGGYYGVDPLAITSDNSKAYVGNLYTENTQVSAFDLIAGTSTTLNTGSPAGLAIANLPLKSLFSFSAPNPNFSTMVQFNQFSLGAPQSYRWEFGDGSTSLEQNPSHIYNSSGFYNVSLTVSRGNNSDTKHLLVNLSADNNVHLTLAGSPYYFASSIGISPSQDLTVDSGVVVNFAPNAGILVQGTIHADGATFQGSETEGWQGIIIQGTQESLVFNNCSILNAIKALTLDNTSMAINNLYISKTAIFTDEVAVQVLGASNPTFSNLQIFNYIRGLVFENQELRVSSSPVITNVRIRNTSSSIRTESTGLQVVGAVGLQINDAQIEEYDNGIYWDGQGSANYRTTPVITNVRIRNTSSSIRNTTTGIKLLNISSVVVQNDSIIGYPDGFLMDNSLENSRTVTAAVITNVRIRNTSSSIRSQSTGIKLLGPILATMDSLEVEDFGTGIYYEGNGASFDRTTPVITNVRIRNTSSSIRSNPIGIMLKNLSAINLHNNVLYPNLSDDSEDNIAGKAVFADGVNSANILNNTIWGFENGVTLSNGTNATLNQNVIWSKGASLDNPILLEGSTILATHNDISYSGGAYPGTGNLNVDPKFVNPELGNFYLKPRSPLRMENMGAHLFDLDAISSWHTKQYHPGWNLIGLPYLTRATGNTPVAIFGDDLSPFYVAPSYTSILQLNQNTMPDSLGHIVFAPALAYNVPAVVRAGVGYWVRNPNTYSTPVDVFGFMDDGSYNLQVQGAMGANNGWFLLANPYDVPIKLSDNSINFGNSMIGAWARMYHYNTNSYDPIIDLAAGDEIPAGAGFFIKANNAADMVFFNYPETRSANQQGSLIASSGFSASQPAKLEWQLSLKASAGEFADQITLGVANSASDTYDGMDVPELPDSPFVLDTKLQLIIPNNDWQDFPGAYTRDIKNRENQAWTWDILLNVENMLVDNCLNETIVLDRDVTAKLPAGYEYRLTDLNTGNSCDLRSGSMQLVLDIDAGDIASGMNPWLIPLRVEVTPVNGMGLQEMQQIVTTGNYPNPFNPSTTISYTLG